jgi:hypothetical protein
MLTQISVNTWKHPSMRVAIETKGGEAAQTGQTARADQSDRFLGFRQNRSSRVITITLMWWKIVRFTSKPTKDNQRAYMTKNDYFTSKLAKAVEALAREGPRVGGNVAGRALGWPASLRTPSLVVEISRRTSTCWGWKIFRVWRDRELICSIGCISIGHNPLYL